MIQHGWVETLKEVRGEKEQVKDSGTQDRLQQTHLISLIFSVFSVIRLSQLSGKARSPCALCPCMS